jgi:hypothetical protein
VLLGAVFPNRRLLLKKLRIAVGQQQQQQQQLEGQQPHKRGAEGPAQQQQQQQLGSPGQSQVMGGGGGALSALGRGGYHCGSQALRLGARNCQRARSHAMAPPAPAQARAARRADTQRWLAAVSEAAAGQRIPELVSLLGGELPAGEGRCVGC